MNNTPPPHLINLSLPLLGSHLTLTRRQVSRNEICPCILKGKQFSFQDLVRNPLTRGSALLFRFLSPDEEFSNMFTPDTVGQVAGTRACLVVSHSDAVVPAHLPVAKPAQRAMQIFLC